MTETNKLNIVSVYYYGQVKFTAGRSVCRPTCAIAVGLRENQY